MFIFRSIQLFDRWVHEIWLQWCYKKMDYVLLYGRTIKEFFKKLENFLSSCKGKNLKLKTIQAEYKRTGRVWWNIDKQWYSEKWTGCQCPPKGHKNTTFCELKKPSNKKNIQFFCRMLASLQSWNPDLLMSIPLLRKAAGSRGKVEWNEELEAEYQAVMKIM